MKIWMHRYLRGSAYSSLTVDENLLKDVNIDLELGYVIAYDQSKVPQIESVEMLEKLIKEYDRGGEYTNDYSILYKNFIEKDGTLKEHAHYDSLYDTVCDLITHYLWDEPYELDDCETVDWNFEVE